jgi:hypothetical protein
MERTNFIFIFSLSPSVLDEKEGATINVEARINDDWLFGSYAGRRGQFPTTFVTEINVALPQHSAP